MTILVATQDLADRKKFCIDICKRLSILDLKILYSKQLIEIPHYNIIISVRCADKEKIAGLRPDCYWTDSYDAREYLKYTGGRELQDFAELASVVLNECIRLDNLEIKVTKDTHFC